MQTLVIGDIHGCWNELQDLLEKAGLASEDTIISLGDMVDRGPETPRVLEFFRSQPNARSLMGNHELKHIRVARKEIQSGPAQTITRLQLGKSYLDALEFMENLPFYIELPEAILVHAYLEPGIPLEQQRETVLCGTMVGDHYLHAHYSQPWYELYVNDKPAIVGHYDHLHNGQPFIYKDQVYNLDTSCVRGKNLTGLLLPAFQIISVPSRGDYWTQLRQQYRQRGLNTFSGGKSSTQIDELSDWDDEID
jgi:serine/threonine protein phosphatase 1